MVLVSYNWYMKRFAALKCTSEKLSDILTPVAMDILNKRISNSTRCTSTAQLESLTAEAFARNPEIGTGICSVHDDEEDTYYSVNLRYRTCTCNMWQEFQIPCKHAIALMKRRKLNPARFTHENWTLERYKEMFEVMGELRCVKYAPYELDETIKPPKHGPFEKIFDSTSEKEIEVCLCEFCGKKSIHKVRGPPKNARVRSSTDLK